MFHFSGGSFEAGSSYGTSNTGGMESLNSESSSVLQVDNALYDTSKYQQMLQEQFLLDSYNSELSNNPFDGKCSGAYSGGTGTGTATLTGTGNVVYNDKNPYYSLGSYASTDNLGQQLSSTDTCHTCTDNKCTYFIYSTST